MQPPAFGRQQALANGVLGEDVTEGVLLALGVDDEQSAAHRLPHRGREPVVVEPARSGEQVVTDRAPEHRGHPHQVLGVRVDLRGAGQQDVVQRGRHVDVGAGHEQFLGDERVALRAFDQAVEFGVRPDRADHGGAQLRELVAGQPLEFDPGDLPRPDELLGQTAQRGRAVPVLVPVGQQQQGVAVQVAQQERDHVERAGVGPVQVLEREDERAEVRHALDDRQRVLEQVGQVARPAGAAAEHGVDVAR